MKDKTEIPNYSFERTDLKQLEELGINIGLHIGFGAFSVAYLAKYKSNKVVLKSTSKTAISPKLIDQELVVSNILKEKVHKNVIKVLEVFADSSLKYFWFVMEWMNGKDMFQVLWAQTPVPFAETVAKNYFKQLVSGLKFLHSLGIVHRDIKPSNILIGKCFDCDQKVLKYIDFGFAKLVTVEEDQAFCISHLGTKTYMAPELMKNPYCSYDAFKSDVYSLAIVLYKMLFNLLPFGSSDMGMDSQQCNYILLKLKENLIIRYPEEITVSESAKYLIESMICSDSDKRFGIEEIEASDWMQN